jgi:hypothetical protein
VREYREGTELLAGEIPWTELNPEHIKGGTHRAGRLKKGKI